MAEYVRRKRPPASHPHWARLHDLTHPPPLRSTFACLGIGGLIAGIYCGLQDAISLSSAMKQASECSLYLSGFFTIGGFFMSMTERRPTGRWSAVGMALLMAGLVFIVTFGIGFILFAAMMTFRWLTGGLDWDRGALVGAAVGLGIASMMAYTERRNWYLRQRRWPRWETTPAARPFPAPYMELNNPEPEWPPLMEPVSQPEPPPVRGTSSHVA